MPRLWNDTIETHRAAVRAATLDATAQLVEAYGVRAVTMSAIAKKTGIGRATLYKYFPDVETILHAWHERQIRGHLEQLAQIRNREADAGQRLDAVLEAYATLSHQSGGQHDAEVAAVLHRDEHIPGARHHVRELIRELLEECSHEGAVRNDVAPVELANYCLHALGAASSLTSKASVRRLVLVTLAGLRPDR